MHQRSLFTLFPPLFAPKTSLLNNSHKIRHLKPFKPSLISLARLKRFCPAPWRKTTSRLAFPPFTYVKWHVLAHDQSCLETPYRTFAPLRGNMHALAPTARRPIFPLRPGVKHSRLSALVLPTTCLCALAHDTLAP